MEAGKATWNKAGEMVQAMPPLARSALVLCVLAIAGGLAYVCLGEFTGDSAFLFSGREFPADQLAEMETAWAQDGLSAYRIQGHRVQVPQKEQAKYLAALADHDALPRDLGDEWLKLSCELNPFLSQAARLETLKIAKQNMLSKIIREMSDVESCWVLVDTCKSGGLKQEEKWTASVGVRGKLHRPLAAHSLQQISVLVAASIAGLDAKDVVVVDLNGAATPAGHAPIPLADEYLSKIKSYQEHYRGLAVDALSFVPGVTVTIQVELERLPTTELDSEAFATALSAPGNGPPGNFDRELDVALPPVAGDQYTAFMGAGQPHDAPRRATPVGASSARRDLDAAGQFIPARVTAAVGVPSEYFHRVWKEKASANPTKAATGPTPPELEAIAAEEIAKIRAVVASVLPHTKAAEPQTALVHVQAFEHRPQAPVEVQLSRQEEIANWLVDNWRPLAAGVVFLLSIAMLRGTLRSLMAPAAAAPAVMHDRTAFDALAAHSADASQRALRDQLQKTVEHDPAAAAEVLRTWLAQRGQREAAASPRG